jgi:syringate O-demethylase
MSTTGTTPQSLESLLAQSGGIVEFLLNQQAGPNVYPGVPAEYSNWRDEQRGWARSCVLFNQSYHMAELMVEGPDAFTFLEGLGVNSFKGFVPDRAKQFVPCSHDGYVIGDVILFYLSENRFNLVGRAPVLNWVQFHAAQGKHKLLCAYDERTAARPDPQNRRHYRYQLQGPNASRVLEAAIGRPPPELRFFHMGSVQIAGRPVRTLRHGMAGQPGYELMGDWADGAAIHAALVEAGRAHDMRLVGGRCYSSNTLESGWIPSPLPAVYTGDAMKPYREWLTSAHYEARASIGGSFVSGRIEDYYTTPWDLGYGSFVKFDHEFIGRAALEKMSAGPHRRKVTLALDNDSVMAAFSTIFDDGLRAKFIEFPSAVYSMHPFDSVTADGRIIGLSTWVGYSANEGRMLTLALLEEPYATPGTTVTLLWGEPDGGTSKPTVERHRQVEIKAIVAPVPYSAVARTSYADSWRNRVSG